jgi:hypothetical protein
VHETAEEQAEFHWSAPEKIERVPKTISRARRPVQRYRF